MATTLTIHDETATGAKTPSLSIDFSEEVVTVRELIRSRVYQEVREHNARSGADTFVGLVQPTDTEQVLNGYKLKTPRLIDWEKQFAIALTAYAENGFIILVNDVQTGDLDEQIHLTRSTEISFLRLLPLVGG